MSDAFNPYEPPASHEDPESDRSRDEPAGLASRSDRLGAGMIDGFIGMAIIVPLQIAFHRFDGFPQIRPLPFLQEIAWGAAGLFVYLAVQGYWLMKSAQTVGKKLVGLQIVNFTDGSPTPGSKIVLARVLPITVVAQIPTVGIALTLLDALFIFGKSRRCLHDFIAGTKVVKLHGASRRAAARRV